jgi:hypothetical protein
MESKARPWKRRKGVVYFHNVTIVKHLAPHFGEPAKGPSDREVVTYMRARGYDLPGFARDNWARLGPLLRGKIHVFAGEMASSSASQIDEAQ